MKTLYTKRYVIVVPAELCERANAAAVEATGEEAARLTWAPEAGAVDNDVTPPSTAICGWSMTEETAAKLMALLGKIGPAKDAAEIAPFDTYGKEAEERAIVESRAISYQL